MKQLKRMEHIESMRQPEQFFAPEPEPEGETAWLASRLLQRQVVDVSAVAPVGRVVDLIFDPRASQVMGLVIQSASERRGPLALLGRLFNWRRSVAIVGLDHVISMDGDVVTLNIDPFRLTPPRELERMARLNTICEMAILTVRGTSLGSLADLLLEDQGTTVTGYIVSPTPAGEQALPALDELTSIASAPASGPAPHMRVIPASSNVRIGESLILLVSEVEPLREEVIVIPQQTAVRAKSNGV